jgi:hypothetical protein
MNIFKYLKFLMATCALTTATASGQVIQYVDNTDDSGVGSLRQIVTSLNFLQLSNEAIIDFSNVQEAALPDQAVIVLQEALPILGRRMTWQASPDLPKPIIRAGGRFRIADLSGFADGATEFINIRFENGNPPASSQTGGAIKYSQGVAGLSVAMRISGCEFFSNITGDEIEENRSLSASGGAIHFVANAFETVVSSLVIEDCLFDSNQALAAGPVAGSAVFVEGAPVTIRDCVFINNEGVGTVAGNGGALAVLGTREPGLIERCLFQANTSDGVASALHLRIGTAASDRPADQVLDCTLIGNSGDGPAVALQGISTFPVLMRNVTIAENAGNLASAVHLQRAKLIMEHGTVAGNVHTDENGGAIHMPLSSLATLEITRSAVAGNRQATDSQSDFYSKDISRINGTVTSLGYNFIGSSTGLSGVFTATGDRIGTATAPLEPVLASPGDYGGPVPTMPPLPESPLVDFIPQAQASFTPLDARGVRRPQGLPGDIGAVELPRIAFTTWDDQIPEPGDRDTLADPDEDSLANKLEYLLESDPNTASPNPVQVVETEEGLFIEVIRSSRIRPAFFTTFRLETSGDLMGWDPVLIEPTVTPAEEGSIDLLRYRYPVADFTGDDRFFRMFTQ